MSNVVKVCEKHGDLTEENVNVEKEKSGKIRYRCKLCKKIKDTKWRENNREQHRASASRARNLDRTKANAWTRQDRLKNIDKYREQNRQYKARNREWIQTLEITRVHGLTVDAYLKMISDQDNKCKICKKEETRRSRTEGNITRLVVDHCHESGIVRGLLCHACNVALGSFKDSEEALAKAIEYLREFKKKKQEVAIPENEEETVWSAYRRSQKQIQTHYKKEEERLENETSGARATINTT